MKTKFLSTLWFVLLCAGSAHGWGNICDHYQKSKIPLLDVIAQKQYTGTLKGDPNTKCYVGVTFNPGTVCGPTTFEYGVHVSLSPLSPDGKAYYGTKSVSSYITKPSEYSMTSSTGLRISNPDNFFERSEGISDMRVKVDKNGNLTDVEGLVKDGWFAGGNCDACAPHYETIRLNCEISPEK